MEPEKRQLKLPEDTRTLLDWAVRYDPRFEGDEMKAIAFFLGLGLRLAQQQSLAEWTPLESEVQSALDQSQDEAIAIASLGE